MPRNDPEARTRYYRERGKALSKKRHRQLADRYRISPKTLKFLIDQGMRLKNPEHRPFEFIRAYELRRAPKPRRRGFGGQGHGGRANRIHPIPQWPCVVCGKRTPFTLYGKPCCRRKCQHKRGNWKKPKTLLELLRDDETE